jgi:hypothetical protein
MFVATFRASTMLFGDRGENSVAVDLASIHRSIRSRG